MWRVPPVEGQRWSFATMMGDITVSLTGLRRPSERAQEFVSSRATSPLRVRRPPPAPPFGFEGWNSVPAVVTLNWALHLEDAWSLLEQWRARRQHNWDLGTAPVEDIVAFILARVGLEVSVINSSDTFKEGRPSFTIHPNSGAAAAVTRLIRTVPDTLFLRGGVPHLKLLSAADTVDYSYGTDHPITRGSYLVQSSRYNRIQAYGDGVLYETIDWEQLGQVTDRLLQVYDLNLNTVLKAQQSGESLLALEEASISVGSIESPPNCGLKLYDLVDVTDPAAGLAASRRRVVGIRLRYKPGSGPQTCLLPYCNLGRGVAMVIKKGVVKGFNATDYRATVQLSGSLAVWLYNVPVARNIAAAEIQSGRKCAVIFFDGGRLRTGGGLRLEQSPGA